MKSVKSKLALAAGVVLTLGSAGAVFAAPITFAQFHELTAGNPNLFSYTETGVAGGTATITALSVPVSFSYIGIPGLPADLSGSLNALLSLTTTTNQPAVNLLGVTDAQAFPTTSTLEITLPSAAAEGTGTQTVLLDMSFTGQLFATPGGGTAQLTGQTGLGNSITYSSDFLKFTNSPPQDFALSLSSWTSADGGPVEVDPISGFFNPATAAGVGTFDTSVGSTTFFPEPNPGALCLVALAAVPLLRRRRSVVR